MRSGIIGISVCFRFFLTLPVNVRSREVQQLPATVQCVHRFHLHETNNAHQSLRAEKMIRAFKFQFAVRSRVRRLLCETQWAFDSHRHERAGEHSRHDQYPSVMKYYAIECFECSAHVLNETNGIFAYTTPIGTCLSVFLLDHDTFAVVLLEFLFHTARVAPIRSL